MERVREGRGVRVERIEKRKRKEQEELPRRSRSLFHSNFCSSAYV